MEGVLNLNQWDAISYPVIMTLVVAMIEGLKRGWKIPVGKWMKGKEPILALFLAYLLGVSFKLWVPMAFKNVPWPIFAVSLFFAWMTSAAIHDRMLKRSKSK